MITCKQLIEFLDSYVEHELPPAQATAFEHHLGACPSCVAYLDGYVKTIELGKATAVDAEAMPEDLVRAILAARQGR